MAEDMESFRKFDKEDIILAPFDYLRQSSGKGIRTKLIKAFNWWLNVDQEKLDLISDIIDILHNASLILDDIEDDSDKRRGKPAAHLIFGIQLSINAAIYACFIALQKAIQLNHPSVPNLLTEQIVDLHRGQGMDIYWRCSSKCPTEAEYKDMVSRKTGGLLGTAVKLMQLVSTATRFEYPLKNMSYFSDYNPLLNALGIWFQIRDDYANLVDTTYHETKDFAEDLTEGKFSFPVVHAINNFPHDHRIMTILQQHTKDRAVKERAIHYLNELGSLEYTARTLIQLEKDVTLVILEQPHIMTSSSLPKCTAAFLKRMPRQPSVELDIESGMGMPITTLLFLVEYQPPQLNYTVLEIYATTTSTFQSYLHPLH
ncbi:hypothetical protein Aperf_G00000084062 [Anoplocephala perfoliata]